MTRVVSLFEQYVKLSNNLHYDAMIAAVRVDDPAQAGRHDCRPHAGGHRGEAEPPRDRVAARAPEPHRSVLEVEVDKLQVDRRIQSRVKKQMEKAQKEYYLNEKMKAIQKELGRKEDKGNEIEDLKKKIEDGRMPKDVEEKAMQELRRLEAMPPMSAEATVSRNYLDWLIAVPWQKKSKESRDLKRAEEILQPGPPRPREDQGPHPRVPRGAHAGQEAEEHHPDVRGPSGRRQDVARQVDRQGDQPQVRAPVARRRARRGRDPRPPPHLHRRVPRPGHPDDEEGRHDEPGLPARRSRQDVDGLPWRPVGGAARGARSRSRTTRSSITTSTSSTTCRT